MGIVGLILNALELIEGRNGLVTRCHFYLEGCDIVGQGMNLCSWTVHVNGIIDYVTCDWLSSPSICFQGPSLL